MIRWPLFLVINAHFLEDFMRTFFRILYPAYVTAGFIFIYTIKKHNER